MTKRRAIALRLFFELFAQGFVGLRHNGTVIGVHDLAGH